MPLILVVAGRASDRAALAAALGAAGHLLLEAGDGPDALALLERHCPDLLIAHVLLPQMDGPELVRRVRALPGRGAMRIAFLAPGYHERDVRTIADQCGASAVLTTAVDPEDLLTRVRRALAGEAEGGDVPVAPARPVAGEQRMLALVECGQRFADAADETALLQDICDACRELLLARSVTMGVAGEQGPPPRVAAVSGVTRAAGAELLAAMPVDEQSAQGVARSAAGGSGRPAAGAPAPARPGDAVTRPMLVVPVVSAATVHGWLCVAGKVTADDFTADDRLVARLLGEVAGRAYEQRRTVGALTARLASLEAAEQRTDFALGAAGAGVWYVDAATETVRLSRSLAALLGLEQVDRSIDEMHRLIADDDRAAVRATVDDALHRTGGFDVEYRSADGTKGVRWFRSIARLSRGPHGEAKQLLGVTIDITHSRLLEQQLRQAQKMEALGQLASGVAHDFNNLLTTILGYTRFLLEDLVDEGSRRDVAQIAKAATRATGLTTQLLTFSRQQLVDTSVLDVHGVIADLGAMLRRLIGEHIELTSVHDADTPFVRANRGYLEQVIVNLVVNARDAMPAGGRILIRTDNVSADPAADAADARLAPGRYLRLSVEDSGCGMSDETKARLFEPFFTTKERSKGTGLGLATVYGIVRQSGGHIVVRSELARGSTFEVYLPVTSEPVAALVPPIPPVRGDGVVLVVEDDTDVRELTCAMLARAGYRVLAARDPAEAVVVFAAAQPQVDVLLTDVVMPGGTGPDLFARLVAIDPRLRVLFMSGYTETAAEDLAALERDAAFLYKPFTADALTHAVRAVLDR